MMFLLILILVHVTQHASGVAVHVFEGAMSVQLPCDVDGYADVKVVWSCSDLNPPTIQQHRGDSDELHPRYKSRTSMSPGVPGFFNRDFSLTLKNPRFSDSGTYTCSVHSGNTLIQQLHVELQVTGILTVLLVLMVLVVAGALGVVVYLWKNTITAFQVVVKEGELLVVLPYKIKCPNLPEDFTVEWSRCAPEPMMVHAFHSSSRHVISQDKLYRGRTSINKALLFTDFSLTLRVPCYRDSGTYICTVHQGRKILLQKAVRLKVKEVHEVVQVGGSCETFIMPFYTAAQLPEDATVEWRCSEPRNAIVHVYAKGQDQPNRQDEGYQGRTKMDSDPLRSKDLSVEVYASGFSDWGTYICTVCRDGYILAMKTVEIQVKVPQSYVEVDQIAKTVKLPWVIKARLPEDAKVEWSLWVWGGLFDTSTVHVYENKQDQPDQQDLEYRGRSSMRKNPLGTGDLSLTLKNPTTQDNRTYLCKVLVNGKLAWQKFVSLKVTNKYWS